MGRVALRLILLLLLLPLVAVGLVFAWIQTDAGQRQAAALVGDLASGPDFGLRVGGISGLVPFDMQVSDVEVADADGVWLTVDHAALAWSPAALLSGTLDVDALTAGTVTVIRPPLPGPEDPVAETEPFGLPELPVGVVVHRLTIDRIGLDAPVLGQPAAFSIDGTARLTDPQTGLRLTLAAERTDGRDGSMAVDLVYTPRENRLSLQAQVDEPAGGVIATLAQLPDLPPVSVRLDGDGALADWQGRLTVMAGEAGDLTLDARVESAEGDYRVTATGNGRLGRFTDDPSLMRLLAGTVGLEAAILMRDDRSLSIDRVGLETPAGSVTLSGTVAPEAGSLALDYRVEAGDDDRFSGLVSGVGWESAMIAGRIEGPLDGPAVTAAVDVRSPVYQDMSAASLTADLTARPEGSLDDPATPIAVEASGRVGELALGTPSLDLLLTPALDWSLTGTLAQEGTVTVSAARVTVPAGDLTLGGLVENWGETVRAEAQLRLDDLGAVSDAAGQPLTGAATLDLDLVIVDGTIGADLAAALIGVTTGQPEVDALLGDRAFVTARIEPVPGGGADVKTLSLRGRNVSVDGEGVIAPDGLAFDWFVALPDLAVLGPDLAGSVTVEGDISGPFDAPTLVATAEVEDLVAGGQTIAAATADVTVGNLLDQPVGDAHIVIPDIAGLAADVAGRFRVEPAGVTALEDLTLALGSLTVEGDLTIEPEGVATGAFSGRAGALAELSPLIGQTLSGSADIDVNLTAPDGRQRVEATVRGRGLAVADAATLRAGTLVLTVNDALGVPSFDAAVDAAGVDAGGLAFGSVDATASGGLDRLAFALSADGTPLSVNGRGTVAVTDEATRIDLAALDATYEGERFALTGPATVALAQDGITVTGLAVAARDGRLALDGRYGDTMDLTLRLDEMPLALAEIASPGLDVAGRLNGTVALSGTRAAPTGTLSLRLAGVGLGAGAPAVNGTVDGRWRDRQLVLDGLFDVAGAGDLTVTAAVPLLLDAGGVPTVPADGIVRANAAGRIDLAILDDYVAAGGDRVAGVADIDLSVQGPLGALRPTGGITVAGASYDNALYGIRLDQIDLTLRGSDRALVLESLSARAPNGGTLSGSGTVVLDALRGLPVDFALRLDNALVTNTDLASVVADADLTLSGLLTETPLLAGTVTVNRAEIRVPDRLPPSVAKLDVVEINAPPEIADRLESERKAAEGSTVDVALAIDASAQQVFVRGRGLDAEVGGALNVVGTSNTPSIDGVLSMRRGRLFILGQTLDFTRGEVTFAGGSGTDPILDFLATTPSADTTIQVAVTGRASSPEFAFSSEPALPEDEVLSRFLFGKATGELTALEAVQLAQSVATLAGFGGGPGVIDKLRTTFGLDRLEVDGGEGGATVNAGRYVSDNVFVGVKQGTAEGSSRATVEIEVTPNVKVETDIGADANSRVGIGVEWDY
ncbi:MAG: translocation/assembly module TamB domain-containing protein [Inquilinaceae bacterium]